MLVDPDDMLKAALKLKDALVLRCCGMALQPGADEKGEWLKITYYDEDGAGRQRALPAADACPANGLRTAVYPPASRARRACPCAGSPPPISWWRNSRRCCAIRILWSPAKEASSGRCAKKSLIMKVASVAPMNWPERTVPNPGRFSLPCGRLSVKMPRALHGRDPANAGFRPAAGSPVAG